MPEPYVEPGREAGKYVRFGGKMTPILDERAIAEDAGVQTRMRVSVPDKAWLLTSSAHTTRIYVEAKRKGSSDDN